MKNVLICYHSAERGGVEQQINDILTGLSNNFNIYILVPNGPFVKDYQKSGAKKVIIYNIKSELDLGFIKRLYSICRKYNINVIHTHELRVGVQAMVVTFFLGISKRIYHVHTSFTEWQHPNKPKKIFANIVNWLANFFAANFFATDVIALNETLKKIRISKELVRESKIRVISNGIDINKIKYDMSGRKRIRKKYCIVEDSFVFGYMARFTEEKAHYDLIIAYKKFCERNRDYYKKTSLLLAGGGKLITEMKELANDFNLTDVVVFTDKFDENDKVAILSAMDIFVAPTHAEGFGISIVEAMCVGLPCILSDLPVLKEVSGGHAVFFKVADEYDLAHKMVDSYNDSALRNQLSIEGRRHSKRYSIKSFYRKYKSLYMS